MTQASTARTIGAPRSKAPRLVLNRETVSHLAENEEQPQHEKAAPRSLNTRCHACSGTCCPYSPYGR